LSSCLQLVLLLLRVARLLAAWHEPAPTEVSAPSLHDALPICSSTASPLDAGRGAATGSSTPTTGCSLPCLHQHPIPRSPPPTPRSEEHTSELQSRENLVCRLLLEKKRLKKQAQRLRCPAQAAI